MTVPQERTGLAEGALWARLEETTHGFRKIVCS